MIEEKRDNQVDPGFTSLQKTNKLFRHKNVYGSDDSPTPPKLYMYSNCLRAFNLLDPTSLFPHNFKTSYNIEFFLA